MRPAGPALADKGALVITSEPGGAKVFIDGQRKGTTPMQRGQNFMLKIEEGEYRVRAEFPGTPAREAEESVYVGGGALQPVHLVPLPLMRRVEAGCFQMGSPAGEPERQDSEGPQHRVCLPAFELGQYEVTFAE